MLQFIAMLEDNEERVAAMRFVLKQELPTYEIIVFDSAPLFILWLTDHLIHTVLICLDHDLGPNRHIDGIHSDPGIGRDVVDYLATQPAICPVVIHSSNAMAVPGMLRELRDSNWDCSSVVPSDDTAWIQGDWRKELIRLKALGLIFSCRSPEEM